MFCQTNLNYNFKKQIQFTGKVFVGEWVADTPKTGIYTQAQDNAEGSEGGGESFYLFLDYWINFENSKHAYFQKTQKVNRGRILPTLRVEDPAGILEEALGKVCFLNF